MLSAVCPLTTSSSLGWGWLLPAATVGAVDGMVWSLIGCPLTRDRERAMNAKSPREACSTSFARCGDTPRG